MKVIILVAIVVALYAVVAVLRIRILYRKTKKMEVHAREAREATQLSDSSADLPAQP